MKEFRFQNAVVRIHGKEPSCMKEATEKFMKKVIICRKQKLKT